MEDKLFEFMTEMYSDLTSRLDNMDKKLDEKAEKKDIVHMENKLDTNSKALFDGYRQTYEKLEILDNKVDSISKEIEKQDIEIKAIKSAR